MNWYDSQKGVVASLEVLLIKLKNWLQTNRQKAEERQTHSSVYRVAPATKNCMK